MKKKSPQSSAPLSLNLIFLLCFWIGLFLQLRFEWEINEQYNYGFFIPFIGSYLFFLRWQDRPEIKNFNIISNNFTYLILALIIFLYYPLRVILLANVDWRMALWGQGMLALSACYIILIRWGGFPWLKHFWFSIAFVLIGIPWPHVVEVKLVQGLMGFVSATTVEVLNFIGIYAAQKGNVITLSNGTVSVEEACSGVRSFQSTLMAGLFLGELFRFSWPRRMLLIILSATFSIFFNIIRTFTLTWIANTQGSEALDRWHDPAGYFVFFASFAVLALISFLLRKKRTRETATNSNTLSPNLFPIPYTIISSALLLLSIFTANLWYQFRGIDLSKASNWDILWSSGASNVKFHKISTGIQNTLFYDEGVMASWETPNAAFLAYFFEWDSPEAGQLAGFHNPELCLPAVGWRLTHKGEDFYWVKNSVTLIFNSYIFSTENSEIFVFNCQWDYGAYPYHQKSNKTYTDRFKDAWLADKKIGKKTLEIIIAGPTSLTQAERELQNFLNNTVSVMPVSSI